jgi:hypothetical protein
MKLCTAVQEGCGYKDTLRAHRYFASLAKYFTVCITYQPAYVFVGLRVQINLRPKVNYGWLSVCLFSRNSEIINSVCEDLQQ